MLKLSGVFTALITPFKDGKPDLEALRKMVSRQLDAGIHGLVPLGSTGEAATISMNEREEILRSVVEENAGRVPIIAGACTNSTSTTIEMVRQARDIGVDAAMIVMPYYNKPTDDGIVAHFEAIGEAVDIPLVAYNVPGRTGSNLTPDCAARLAAMEAVVALKEASGNVAQVMEIARRTAGQWDLFSGEDALLLPILAAGGSGLISVSSNIAPEAFAAIFNFWAAGDIEASRKAQLDQYPLIQAMFSSSNPIPVKAAAAMLGLCANELRLPLLPLEGQAHEDLRGKLLKAGIL